MENKNLNIALEGSIIRSIITLSIPILIANLLQSAYQLIDAFWVWRLWWNAVAAVSISFPVTFFMISLWTWFAIAWSTLIAQYVWAKNKEMVNHVAAQTLLMVAVVSLLLWTIWYIASPFLLNLMWVSSTVFGDALSFMRVSFVWLVFVFWFFMFQSIMRWVWQVKIPLYIVFSTVCLNFILDPLFIYGYWPIPAWWVSWAALATLFTQWIAAVIGFIILLWWKYSIHLYLKDFKPDFDYIKKAFFLWLPSSIEMSARALWLVVMTFLITSFWTLAVASYWAWSTILQVIMIPAMWISMATATLVWQNIWAKNYERAKQIAIVSTWIAFLSLTFVGILSYIFAPWLVKFFVPNDLLVIEWWSLFIRAVSLTFWLVWIQIVIMWVFRAAWSMMTTLVVSLVSQWVIQFPLAYILSKHTTLWITWLWYAFPIVNILMAAISILLFVRWNWQKSLITEEEKIIEKISEESIIEEWIR